MCTLPSQGDQCILHLMLPPHQDCCSTDSHHCYFRILQCHSSHCMYGTSAPLLGMAMAHWSGNMLHGLQLACCVSEDHALLQKKQTFVGGVMHPANGRNLAAALVA